MVPDLFFLVSISRLFSNQLTGTIPETIGNLENATAMYVPFFTHLSLFSLLTSLFQYLAFISYLDENQLTGEIPQSLVKLVNLMALCVFHFFVVAQIRLN